MKKFLSIILIAIFIVNMNTLSFTTSASFFDESNDNNVSNSLMNYNEYSENNEYSFSDTVICDINSVVKQDKTDKNSESSVFISNNGFAKWKFSLLNDSSFVCLITYKPVGNDSGDIELELKIDDEIPFKEVSLISLKRTYINKNKSCKQNISGDDLQPETEQTYSYSSSYVSDASGYITEPLRFHLPKGEHTLSLTGSRGNALIKKISLTNYEAPKTYKEYYSEKKELINESEKVKEIVVEGEKFYSKNSVIVVPKTDRTSPSTTPQSSVNLKLNTIGGSNWKTPGDSVSWEIDIPKTGFYNLALRFRQNTKDGIFTSRKLLIDNEVPFSEAASLRFNYNANWQCENLGDKDGNAYFFYLSEGKHLLTLEAVTGDTSEIIKTVETSIGELNDVYRKIALITGVKPDKNRTYGFNQLIPDELKKMSDIKESLQKSVKYIKAQSGANGSFVSIINKVIFQLEKMTENSKNIPKYLEKFKSNLSSLGEWLLDASTQPLQIDKFYIIPGGAENSNKESSFIKRTWFALKCFVSSYTTDYSSIGLTTNQKDSDELAVWIQTGRDQGEIIRQLIDVDFSKSSNATVELKVVSSGLLQSVLAGLSPDVVLDCAEAIPIEYALRNAVVDMKIFKDFDSFSKTFTKASLIPVTFNGSVYAIPQTFDFYMFFYRKDIFSEYNITPPKTWKQLRSMILTLQRNGFQLGLPHDINFYATLAYQNKGNFYNDSGSKINLSSNKMIESFTDFTEFFTLYDCPVTYNFVNRFRSGEMPCAVINYSQYNQLTAFAPEIKGLWEMVPIPGVEDKDGNIDNTAVGIGTYIMIMRSSKYKELAWNFIKWFMSDDVQSTYAVKMESILGSCAKVMSANVNALSKMTWSSNEYKNLFEQMKFLSAIRQVPGGYYLPRTINFAFNRVYNNDENPDEVITNYISELNEEILRKRQEFGLEE